MLRTTECEGGKLRGLPGNDPRITVFKGIPFAAPPVGDLRWKAPQPAQPWDGVKEAFEYAPIPVQDTPGIGDDLYSREWHVDSGIPISEDCLYLNVWTPANKTDEKLPVLVWIFGGGFQWGYTAEMEFDGERLASRGIIVVSVAYRLGALGFLAHPEITAESPDAPGNFGFLDQQAGLRWVYRNIAAFGGDPEKITIAGQSAGGASVLNQLTCKANSDIIKGAIIYSGIIRFASNDMEKDLFFPKPLEEAEKKGEEFFEYLGVSSLEEARKLDAFTIRAKYAEYRAQNTFFVGIADGKFNVGDPTARLMECEWPNIPLITGNTIDEFVINGENRVETSVKLAFNEILKKDPTRKLYYYRFGPDIPGDDNPGCFHSCDLWFFFETILKCRRPYQGRHMDLARKMTNYIAAFVKTGDPNCLDNDGTEQVRWENYTLDNRYEMNFVSEGTVAGKEA